MPSVGGKGSRTRKTLSFFRVNFGHSPPYEVLCDGPTIFQSLHNDLYLKQALPNLLGGPAYPVVTECVLRELRSLGEAYTNAAVFAKRTKRIPCVHEGKASATDCLLSLLRNQSDTKFVLATNDPDLVAKVAQIPGVPIVSVLNQRKFALKAPSSATMQFVKKYEKVKNHGLSGPDKALIDDLKTANRQLLEKRLLRKKRKRAKGPNPLSVKKSKVNHEKMGGNQRGSSLHAGSVVSPDDLLISNTQNGETNGLDSKSTREQAADIKLRQSNIDSQDAHETKYYRKRNRRVSIHSDGFSDLDENGAIKNRGGTAEKVTIGSCVASKCGRKRIGEEGKGIDDTDAATKAERLSETVNTISACPQAVRPLPLETNLGSGDGSSQRRIIQSLPTRTAESEGASSPDGSVETEGTAITGGPRLLEHKPNADERESSEGYIAAKEQMKKYNSNGPENGNRHESQRSMVGRKNIACSTDNANLTELDETRTAGEEDVQDTSASAEGKKKKKQRKNRRRRPKKKGSD